MIVLSQVIGGGRSLGQNATNVNAKDLLHNAGRWPFSLFLKGTGLTNLVVSGVGEFFLISHEFHFERGLDMFFEGLFDEIYGFWGTESQTLFFKKGLKGNFEGRSFNRGGQTLTKFSRDGRLLGAEMFEEIWPALLKGAQI
jgi:hypothetical protein